MWIERLEFIGYGNLTGQRIDFARNKLSVVVQPNEYGKSTMSDAIWSILYDYPEWNPATSGSRPGIERKPLSGAAFKACLDVSLTERHIRLIRNFSERSLKILDLSKDLGKATADITQEYSAAIAADEFGRELTGLSREMFRNVCVLAQRQLQKQPFSGDRALSTFLFNVADSAGTSSNVFDAVSHIEASMAEFPFRGKHHAVQDLIDNLEHQKRDLSETLQRIEAERKSCDVDLERLSALDELLRTRGKAVAIDEYFQLCLEAADIDSRLTRAQDKLVRVGQLRDECQKLSTFENFPILRHYDVQELWMRRQARLSDLKRLQNEIQSKSMEVQIRDLEHRERSEGLSEFTVEDAQILSSLARTWQAVLNEVDETRRRRHEESTRVRSIGVDLDSLASVRHSLLTLEPKDLDDAHAYHAMFVAARDRAAECERGADNARTIIKEIDEARYVVRSNLSRAFWVCILVGTMLLVPLLYLLLAQHVGLSDWRLVLVLVLWAVMCVFGGILFSISNGVVSVFERKEDENRARSDELKQQSLANEMWSKAAGLETRIEDLARKASLSSAQQLIQNMQEYTVCAAQLKELDLLDHMLGSQRLHADKLRNQVVQFFERAHRAVNAEELLPKHALKLADDINRCLDDERRVQSSTELLDHRQSEMRFLSDDIKDVDSILQNHFSLAGLVFNNVEDGYTSFTEAVNAYKQWESYKVELDRLESDTTTDLPLAELPALIERLEHKRADIWAGMQQLITTTPEIVNTPPPPAEAMLLVSGKEIADRKHDVKELKLERDELTVQIRAAMRNFQDNYLKTLEELEGVERELAYVQRTRTSLMLARDMLLRLADENHSVWADRLNDIAREMLKHLGTDYETLEFDADLSVTVRRKGQREPINEWHMVNQLSAGTREQLHWLARMAVVRFLSKHKTLPIILDEPFSEFDDERFLKMMRFLITSLSRHNQVIIFSCHQQRHEWLIEQLDPRERDSIELCRLVPLNIDSNAVVRR